MPVGTHTVVVGGVDWSCLVDTVTVNHGRDDPGSQPEASSATITLAATDVDPLPYTADVGTAVVVITTTAGGYFDRFAGRITDLSLGWEDAGADTPDAGLGEIVAVGALADLGRRVVGDTPWPQELDGARVSRVLAAAGVTLDPLTSDPGTVQLLPRDVDSAQALDVATSAAVSGAGVLWQARAGDVRYADADHRRGAPVALTLDACDLLVTPTWRRNLEGLVNSISLGYGPTPEGSEQPRYVASNAASISKWGTYEYTSSTELAALADAQAQGSLLLSRNSSPAWVMAALPVDVAGLSAATYDALLALDMHSLVVLTGLPAVGGAPTSATLWVEGWREELAYGTHTMELVVSGYCRTVPAPRWDDVDPTWTWGGADYFELRRNLVTNPSMEQGTGTGWSGYGTGTVLSVVSDPAPASGAKVLQAAMGTTGGAGAGLWSMPVTPGTRYAARVSLRTPDAAVPVYARLQFVDASNAQTALVAGATVTPGPHQWATATVEATAPAGSATVRILAQRPGTSAVAGQRLLIDAAMVVAVPAGTTFDPTYFDGDTPDTTQREYRWTGTHQLSASAERRVAMHSTTGVPPTLTWDDAACLGPPHNYGRWNDQPATLRWDQLDPVTTWDDYMTGAL